MNLKTLFFIFYLSLLNCSSDGKHLKVVSDLPYDLYEISGIEKNDDSEIIWAVNDSGNKPLLYGIDQQGEIIKTLKINAENIYWEDLTMDD